jgi:OOP family OmpA-OmpF porin
MPTETALTTMTATHSKRQMRRTLTVQRVLLGSMILLGGCAGFGLEEAKKTTPSGSEFNSALFEGYLELSETEYREGDYADSDVFAGRAIQAAANASFGPEEVGQRRIPDAKVSELVSARDRLVKALDVGAVREKPRVAARAQVMFDCWMQEQEENSQPNDIEQCRSKFLTALAKIEVKPQIVVPAPPPPSPAPPPLQPVPLPGPYVVYFDLDKSQLSESSRATLAKVIGDAKSVNGATIVAGGHADRTGSERYNDTLSLRRANAVVSYLLKTANFDLDKVVAVGFGETKPDVETVDGVAEPRNRRVEILFER